MEYRVKLTNSYGICLWGWKTECKMPCKNRDRQSQILPVADTLSRPVESSLLISIHLEWKIVSQIKKTIEIDEMERNNKKSILKVTWKKYLCASTRCTLKTHFKYKTTSNTFSCFNKLFFPDFFVRYLLDDVFFCLKLQTYTRRSKKSHRVNCKGVFKLYQSTIFLLIIFLWIDINGNRLLNGAMRFYWKRFLN